MLERAQQQLRRPVVAGLVLLVAYVGLSFLNSTGGYLGTDTGAKVATLETMSREGRLDPDVGYWAAAWDPAGAVHPLYDTVQRDGRWVNVTTLPMLYAAMPLYSLGGYRLALLLPMAGAVAVALGAGALARRLGAVAWWRATWLVGLASPIAIYALDFWEHAPGVALMLWAGIQLHDIATGSKSWWKPLVAGALLGLAFTMRTESLVYIGVFGVGVAAALLRRREVGRLLRSAGLAAVGIAGVVLANLALELATVGQNMRLARAGGAARAAGAAVAPTPGNRVQDIFATTVNLTPTLDASGFVLGVISLAALVAFAIEALRSAPDERRLRIIGAIVVALYLFRVIDGLGFVPGLFAAAPIAALGLVALRLRGPVRAVAATALLALPVVWVFQYRGGAVPQWGGRYQLVSGTILVIVGAVVLERLPRAVRATFVGVAVVITAFGLLWLHQRSREVGAASSALARQPQPVLVSTVAHLWREVGSSYGEHLTLTAATPEQLPVAARVVGDAGYRQLGLVVLASDAPPPELAGWTPGARVQVLFLSGVPLDVITYDKAS